MNSLIAKLSPSGVVGLKVFRSLPSRPLTFREIVRFGFPAFGESREVNLWRLRNIPNLLRGMWRVAAARVLKVPHFYGVLSLRLTRSNGEIVNYGLASMRVVTDVGVGYIVDAFQNIVELENMKFHGFGSGTTNEAAADTSLVTEFTTEYAVNSTRPTGSTTEGATANIYRSVATFTPDAAAAVTEHGLFSASSAGVLFDRSKFTVVNLNGSGDSLQSTYDATFTSGS